MCSWYSKMVIDERNQEKSDANMKPGSKVKRRSFHIFVKDFPSTFWWSTFPCKGKVVEKPKTRNRSRGHPDNKLLGEEATWGVQQKMSGGCFAQLIYNQATWTETSSSSKICSSLKWPSPTTKATRWSHFEKTSKWFSRGWRSILKWFSRAAFYSYEAFRLREGWKTRWWRRLPTWRRGKRFGGKQLLLQSKWIDDLFVCNL